MEQRMAKKLTACILSVSMVFGGMAAGVPKEAQAAAKKSVTVTEQAELNQALKSSRVSKITVKTKKAVSLTVKKGDYKDKTLVLSGKKITLQNTGRFQKISIHDAKQFTEKASNNTFSVTDPNTLKLTADKNAKISEVRLNSRSEKVVIAADGQVRSLAVNSAGSCVLKGSTKKTVAVKVASAGKGAKVKLAVPSFVKSNANATITASAGAEGAVIQAMHAGVKVSVINGSKGNITLMDANGNQKKLTSGKRAFSTDLASDAKNKQNKVTFDLNYDTAGARQTVSVQSGKKAAQPQNPVRSGYSFDGWYTKADGGEKFDFAKAITADLTLYAHWTETVSAVNQKKVTFAWNYGSAGTYQTVSVNAGGKAAQPANPVRSGYQFNGWYTSEDGGEKFSFDEPITADVILYAHWSLSGNMGGSSIGNGGSGSSGSGSTGGNSGGNIGDNGTGSGGSTGDNSTGSGGSTGDNSAGSGGSTGDNGTGNGSGGSIGDNGTGNGSGGSTGDNSTGNGGSTGDNGTGNGGSTGDNGTGNGGDGSGGNTGGSGSEPSDPTPNSYSIRYYWNDGTDEVYQTDSIASASTIVKPSDPTRTGYTFEGWYQSADLTMRFDFTSIVSKDIDLYAKWKKKETEVKSDNGVKISISEYYETVTEMRPVLQGTMSGANNVLWTVSDGSGHYDKGEAFIDSGNWTIKDVQLHEGKNTFEITAIKQENGDTAVLNDIDIIYDHGEMQAYTSEDITYFKDEDGSDAEDGYINNVIIVTLNDDSEKPDREQARADREEALTRICDRVNGEVVGQINGALMYQIRLHADQSRLADDADPYENLQTLCEEAKEAGGDLVVADVSCDLVQPQEDPVEAAEVPAESVYQLQNFAGEIKIPNDPWAYDQDWDEENPSGLNWWAEAVRAPSAWALDHYFRDITIGIVDSGIQRGHEDLPDFETVNEGNVVKSHGTHVAGIIGAKDNNEKGITGMVWKKKLYNYDAYQGATTTFRIADGVTKLIESGCKVVNNSNGSKYSSVTAAAGSAKQAATLVENLSRRVTQDFIIVCAAGNDTWDSRRNGSFSAIESGEALDHIIVVAAADMPNGGDYKLAWFSNYGQYVTVAAPGARIYSTVDTGNGYGLKNGTSMAAPIVTGIVSLVWSVNEHMKAKEVKQIIIDTAQKDVVKPYVSSDNRTYDLVDAAAAVKKAIRQTCGDGDVKGCFVDAATGNAMPNVSYRIHESTNSGPVILDYLTADENGEFSFSLPANQYVIEAYGDFVTSYTPVTVLPFETVQLGDIPLTYALESNTCRVVLEWGLYPSDLDSHFNANKKDDGRRLHVFYAHKKEPEANLDVDDVTSYGPETITVENFGKLDGFVYSVHNFTHRGAQSGEPGAFSGTGSLANSGATVKIYVGDTLRATYKVPENQAGTVWNVFKIDAGGRITTLNTFAYISNPVAVGAGYVNADSSDSMEDYDLEKTGADSGSTAESASLISEGGSETEEHTDQPAGNGSETAESTDPSSGGSSDAAADKNEASDAGSGTAADKKEASDAGSDAKDPDKTSVAGSDAAADSDKTSNSSDAAENTGTSAKSDAQLTQGTENPAENGTDPGKDAA